MINVARRRRRRRALIRFKKSEELTLSLVGWLLSCRLPAVIFPDDDEGETCHI